MQQNPKKSPKKPPPEPPQQPRPGTPRDGDPARMIPEAAQEKAEKLVKEQAPVDKVDLESMESFPASDPPGTGAHA